MLSARRREVGCYGKAWFEFGQAAAPTTPMGVFHPVSYINWRSKGLCCTHADAFRPLTSGQLRRLGGACSSNATCYHSSQRHLLSKRYHIIVGKTYGIPSAFPLA